jgi:hypothetical protein
MVSFTGSDAPSLNLALKAPPQRAPPCDVRPVLFGRAQSFFIVEAGAIQKLPDRVIADIDFALRENQTQRLSSRHRSSE